MIRLSLNRPDFLVFAHTCVKPRNWNVSGLPRPRALRFRAANRPNSISRVFSAFSSKPNFASLSRRSDPEPLRVIPVLEPHHEVISPAHDDHITARVPSPPLVSPEVEDIVQVDVRQER